MGMSRAFAAMAIASALIGCTPLAAQTPEGGDQSVEGPAGAIYVDDGGGKDGLPVVFLHAFAGDSSQWADQLSHLRHHRRALAIDLRGHGKSAGPRDNDYSIDSMVKDVEAVVKKLELPRFVLVGHSLGGAVAIHYAAAHPDKVAGLVMVNAPGKVPPQQASLVLESVENDYDKTMKEYWDTLVTGAQPHVRTQILERSNSVQREPAIAIMKSIAADDPLEALDRYKGLKLIIYTALRDTPTDLQNERTSIGHIRVDGTSHWPQLDTPGFFNRLLDDFLALVK
ncbi:MAG TPA: alpha/beta hydrolase [Usitatibacter sp.]|jgi:pimeloyl-ACP methyl ester carboxylesterase|nr:alpha/beta hydrolase [Usitatibacter sp.]